MSTTWHVSRVAVTGSTNDDLLAAGRDGAAHGTVLMADLQTAGRGRLDRRWDAPAGANLLVSLLLRDLGAAPHEAVRRVALAARAAAETAGQTAHGASEIVLKWPNDLLVRGADDSAAKLAGILAQLGHSSTGPFVVVGVGMNIGWAPEGAARLGDGIAPGDVLDAMLAAYDALPDDTMPLYRQHLATIGQAVRVELSDGEIVGRATGVEADGRLVVADDSGVTHHIDTGDVVHLRPR